MLAHINVLHACICDCRLVDIVRPSDADVFLLRVATRGGDRAAILYMFLVCSRNVYAARRDLHYGIAMRLRSEHIWRISACSVNIASRCVPEAPALVCRCKRRCAVSLGLPQHWRCVVDHLLLGSVFATERFVI